jgi:hypothetical protein
MKAWRWAPAALGLWGVVLFSFLLGIAAAERRWPPYMVFANARDEIKALARLARGRLDEPYFATTEHRLAVLHRPAEMAPGMTLISGVGPKGSLFVKLIDADGKVEHAWDVDWFRLWPDATHVPDVVRPRERPGTMVHGMLLSANGDLTFNYEGLGLIRLDLCGHPRWRLARLTSHSLFRDEDGNLWTFDYVSRDRVNPELPNLGPPFVENRILKVSPEGKVLKVISVTDLLTRNGYQGLLYMQAPDHDDTRVMGNTLHMNSVEVFPSGVPSAYFKPGDIMISLRNLSSIIIFDQNTLKIRAILPGRFVRQHDPHFVDGSTITIFDNNTVNNDSASSSSRILSYSFKDNQPRVLFQGTPAHRFYTASMGKQYTLPNGNLLLTEAIGSRAIEVSPRGELLWEYYNQVRPGVLGLLSDAQRIPPDFLSVEQLRAMKTSCRAT